MDRRRKEKTTRGIDDHFGMVTGSGKRMLPIVGSTMFEIQ